MEEKLNLEKALARIEEIAKKLENGANLDECIKLYEEGIRLSRECMERLEDAKGKISQIRDDKEEEIDG